MDRAIAWGGPHLRSNRILCNTLIFQIDFDSNTIIYIYNILENGGGLVFVVVD